MNEALAVIEAQPPVHLVARNPVEMQQSQSSLADWLRAKIAEVEAESRDYRESLELATKNKWNKRVRCGEQGTGPAGLGGFRFGMEGIVFALVELGVERLV